MHTFWIIGAHAMRRTAKKCAFSLLVIVWWSFPTLAQTPEETALFLLWGLEEGTKRPDTGTPIVRQINRTTWEILEGAEKGKIQVIQITSCTYRFVHGDESRLFDFNKVRDIDVRPRPRGGVIVRITGPGIISTVRNGQVNSLNEIVQMHDFSMRDITEPFPIFVRSFVKEERSNIIQHLGWLSAASVGWAKARSAVPARSASIEFVASRMVGSLRSLSPPYDL